MPRTPTRFAAGACKSSWRPGRSGAGRPLKTCAGPRRREAPELWPSGSGDSEPAAPFPFQGQWIPAPATKKALKTGLKNGAVPADVPAARKPRLEARGRSLLYLEPRFPRPRLVIAGAGHVGRAVAGMGGFLGFETIVIDDRPELLLPARFPAAARLVCGDIAAGRPASAATRTRTSSSLPAAIATTPKPCGPASAAGPATSA